MVGRGPGNGGARIRLGPVAEGPNRAGRALFLVGSQIWPETQEMGQKSLLGPKVAREGPKVAREGLGEGVQKGSPGGVQTELGGVQTELGGPFRRAPRGAKFYCQKSLFRWEFYKNDPGPRGPNRKFLSTGPPPKRPFRPKPRKKGVEAFGFCQKCTFAGGPKSGFFHFFRKSGDSRSKNHFSRTNSRQFLKKTSKSGHVLGRRGSLLSRKCENFLLAGTPACFSPGFREIWRVALSAFANSGKI